MNLFRLDNVMPLAKQSNASPSWAFTSETVLPTSPALPDTHIKLLDDFFIVVDQITQDPDAAKQFAPLFTKDGVWKTPSAAFRGSNELAQSGYTWEYLKDRKSMRHWVNKVFVNDVRGVDEIMLLARIKIENKDGTTVDVPFSAWVIFQTGEDGQVRLKWFQGWSSRV